MAYLYIDLETRSEVNVGGTNGVGAFAYAEHPSTKILCAAWAIDDEPVQVGPTLPGFLYTAGPDLTLVSHNADFERCALRGHGLYVPNERWLDTAALAARMSLPRNLEELGEFFFPDDPTMHKNMVGNRVMKKLSSPRRPSKDNPDRWWTPETKPDDFQTLYAYCAQDVVVMRAVHKKLMALEPKEEEIRLLTDKMNWRGVKLDLASIPPAQATLAGYSTALAAEFTAITGCPVKSPVKVAEFLGLEDMRKPTVRKALREPNVPPLHRRAMEIQTQLARSSTSKLAAMKRRVSADGRLRGAMVYCGAERTARWSSMGVQLQNFPRGLGEETDLAFEALHAGVLDEVFTGMERPAPQKPLDPVGTVAEMLRGYLLGDLWVGDLAQIEARVLLWLAGQADRLQMFRDGEDLYCEMASRIYGGTVTKKDKDKRFVGKTVTLGAGYGIGWRGFQRSMDETYDVPIDDAFAKKVIDTYRRANPRVTAYWTRLENGMKFAIANKSKRIAVTSAPLPPLFMGTLTHAGVPYAFIELPSGRRLYYARPELSKDSEIRYFGRDIRQGGMWTRIGTYGGKLAENVTQATSRDVLAEAMLRLDALGFPLVATVHDEIVSETPPNVSDPAKLLHDEMTRVPSWATGLPIEAEVFGPVARYRK